MKNRSIKRTTRGLSLRERLDFYTDKRSDCWEWTGYRNNSGYGRLMVGNQAMFAHRLTYEMQNGSIPDGLCVLHKCDNRGCVNPDHLFLGNRSDNNADMLAKGREVVLKGVFHGRAKLTDVQVLAIRQSQAPPLDMASQFGVSLSTVHHIRYRRTWRHLL
jgi:hypothetical protein